MGKGTEVEGEHLLNPLQIGKDKNWKLILSALIVGAALLVGGGVMAKLTVFADAGATPASRSGGVHASQGKSKMAPHEDPRNQKTPATPPDVTFTVAATGDFLPHFPVTQAARLPDGRYAQSLSLAAIKPWIQGADLALCHQEVPFGRPGDKPHGYPIFSMPHEMAQDMAENLGYDGCSTASNHTWDQGHEGLVRTVETLQAAGMGVTGSRRSVTETPWQMYELTKGGRTIKIAHLSFTYGLNHGRVAYIETNPWAVEINNPQQIVDNARQARVAGAEVVIASVHGGNEYQYEPSKQQLEWSQMLANSGEIDLYIGHHVHVPQQIVKLPGGRSGQGMWVYYGLGNIMSGMNPNQSNGTQIEQLAWVTLTVPGNPKQPVKVEAQYLPVVLDRVVRRAYPAEPFAAGQVPAGAKISVGAAREYYQLLQKVAGNQVGELPAAAGVPRHGGTATVKALPRQ